MNQGSNSYYRHLGVTGMKKVAHDYHVEDDIAFAKKYSRGSQEILDLACGYGRVSIPLAAAGHSVTGIDLSPVLIKEARQSVRKKKLKINFDIGDMRQLPYKNESFDAVLCLWNSLNHILAPKDQLRVLNEIHRVLRPGGKAFLSVSNGESKRRRLLLKQKGSGSGKRVVTEKIAGIEVSLYFQDRRSLTQLCRTSRFKDFNVRFKNMNGRRRVAVFLKK